MPNPYDPSLSMRALGGPLGDFQTYSDDPGYVEREAAVLARGTPSPLDNQLIEIMKWVNQPPPWARDPWFNKCEQVTLAANASLVAITGYRIKYGLVGVLRFVAFAVGNSSDAAFVKFFLMLDDQPVSGYANTVGPISSGVSSPDAIIIPVLSGQAIVVKASNTSGASITGVQARIKGWKWGLGLTR